MSMKNTTDLNKILSYESKVPYANVVYEGISLRLAVPNRKCYYFASSIGTREKDTNHWMRDLTSTDIFFDVGANNSIFSLVASKVHKCRSYAFEPHFASYYVSQLNLFANGLENVMSVFPVAVSDGVGLDFLWLSDRSAGKSLNNFGQMRESDDALWNAVIPQGACSMPLDLIVNKLGVCPTFLKVDVDGIESKIIAGAMNVLDDPSLKKIMIEFNKESSDDMKAFFVLQDKGFVLEFAGPSGYFFKRR